VGGVRLEYRFSPDFFIFYALKKLVLKSTECLSFILENPQRLKVSKDNIENPESQKNLYIIDFYRVKYLE